MECSQQTSLLDINNIADKLDIQITVHAIKIFHNLLGTRTSIYAFYSTRMYVTVHKNARKHTQLRKFVRNEI